MAPRRIPGLELGIAPRAIPHPASAPRIRRHTVRAYDQAVNDPLEQQELRAPVPRGTAFATGFIDRLMRQHPPLFADPAPAR